MSATTEHQANPCGDVDHLGAPRARPGPVTPLHADRIVTATQAKLWLPQLVSAAALQGRRILITHRGKPVAALIPTRDLARLEVAERQSQLDLPLEPR